MSAEPHMFSVVRVFDRADRGGGGRSLPQVKSAAYQSVREGQESYKKLVCVCQREGNTDHLFNKKSVFMLFARRNDHLSLSVRSSTDLV